VQARFAHAADGGNESLATLKTFAIFSPLLKEGRISGVGDLRLGENRVRETPSAQGTMAEPVCQKGLGRDRVDQAKPSPQDADGFGGQRQSNLIQVGKACGLKRSAQHLHRGCDA
jgi:hypothetical protein